MTHNLQPALNLIKEFEGLFLYAYDDGTGVPTIGWGTIEYPNGQRVRHGDTCTRKQAEEWLNFEVNQKVLALEELITVQLTNNEFCALVSFAYNVGVAAVARSSLVKLLNDGEPPVKVADEFLRWTRAGGRVIAGLVRRRKAERALFLTPDAAFCEYEADKAKEALKRWEANLGNDG